MKKLITLLLVLMLAFSSFAACGGKKPVDSSPDEPAASTYTYNGAANSLPTAWNVHTYQSNDANTVLGYTEDSLYTFDYNEAKNGYQIVPSMAKEFPIDVTSEFVGKYGIEEGETGKAYKINLREDLKFDNGDPIKAADFVESAKRLLNPEAANYRANSLYSGNMVIVNARNYALAGSTVITSARSIHETWDAAKVDSSIVFDLMSDNTGFAQFGVGRGYTSYKDATYGWGGLLKALGIIPSADYCAPLQDKTFAEIEADEALLAIWTTVIDGWKTDPNEELDFFGRYDQMPEVSWDEVGYQLAGEYSFYLILEKELTGFYLKYSLSGALSLVHVPTYDKCTAEVQGVYTNTYGTSASTYVGFGAYMIDSYVADSVVTFKRNPHWYGYGDPANEGLYQTTNINIKQVSSAETRLNMFLAGDLDSYGLDAADMATYQGSDHTYYTDGDSTWFVALNPDMEGLETAQGNATPTVAGREVNKTILTVKEFRQALSFSIDRAAYALALDPLGATAKALYGNMIISDPENGTAYRTTEEAKDTILAFWGLTDEVGEGKTYATKDEAIASITGYDLAGAKELFNQAYDIAVAQGLIKNPDNFEIQIVIGQPGSGSSAYYNNGYELLKKVWTDAVVGTDLEGKLVFTQSQPLGSTSFSDFLKKNEVDVLFGVGWTGSALDPYGLMEAYVHPNYQYDPGWDTAGTFIDIEIDGKVLRASVYDWGYTALGGDVITCGVVGANGEIDEEAEPVEISAGVDADMSLRLKILAAVEGAVLQQYDMIPINLDASANLKGMKIKYGTEEYVYGVGRGGIKYMTYNLDDAGWAEYVKENGGKLDYT